MPEIKKISVNEEEQELTVAELGIWEDVDDEPEFDDDDISVNDDEPVDDFDILPDDDDFDDDFDESDEDDLDDEF